LRRGVEQLRVTGEEGAGAGTAGGPGKRGGQLQGAGCLEGKAVEQALSLVAQERIGSDLAPLGAQPVENDLSLNPAIRRKLSHPGQSSKGAANLNRRSPPDNNAVSLADGLGGRRGRLLHAKRDEGARVPKGRFHLAIALGPFNGFFDRFVGDAGPGQSPEGLPVHGVRVARGRDDAGGDERRFLGIIAGSGLKKQNVS